MRVLQATAWCRPFQMGGTEVYVEGLVDELNGRGISSTVIVPRGDNMPESYSHRSTEIQTYPVNEVPSIRELRRGEAHEGFESFLALLRQHRGAIYHQHSWTRGCGLAHLRAAKAEGYRTVFTMHVPGPLCLRGTMQMFGREACDGRISGSRCASCWLQSSGLPSLPSNALSRLPAGMAKAAFRLPGALGSALGVRAAAERKKKDLLEMVSCADLVVAVCQWAYDALRLNGVAEEKLIVNRQGLSAAWIDSAVLARATHDIDRSAQTLSLVYVGRLDPTKGVHIVVDAIRALPPTVPVTLTIHGHASGVEGQSYEVALKRSAKGDSRVRFGGPVGHDSLPDTMCKHDVLVVPSTWLETGPLVVLEGQAIGLHILGSNLGGIAELATDPVRATLVPPGNVEAWANAIRELASARALLREQMGPVCVRGMPMVAKEMAQIYQRLASTG
jgi:glycosyltransferase involved in cell wall biosynthesis